MFRRLPSIVIVPALLILLTAGAVQARPLHPQTPPAGLLTQVWQALSSTGLWIKEGLGMDPNGNSNKPRPVRRPSGREISRAPSS